MAYSIARSGNEEVATDRSRQFFQSHRVLKSEWNKRGSGFEQRDYALQNAAWHVTDLLAEMRQGGDRHEGFNDVMTSLRPGPEVKVDIGTPEVAAEEVKTAAKAFGASLLSASLHSIRGGITSRSLPERSAKRGKTRY
jgi:hypothetical protein